LTSRWPLARTLASGLGVALGFAILFLVVVTPLEASRQLLLGAAFFVLALALNRLRGPVASLGLVVLSVTVSSRYLFWRLSRTIGGEWSVDLLVGAVLLGAELYAFVMLLMGYLQSLGMLERKPAPLPSDPATWPSVDIYVPTYNEPLEVVRTTVLAARAIDWPSEKLNVFLLDDGRRDEFRAFAAKAGIGYIVRPDNKHAKAGNLNHAMTRTQGEFIAIFDCDHIPTRSFLQVTMGWFLRDPRLAMLQTPHHFYSPDPFERNLGTFRRVPNEGELFYGLIQPGNDIWDAVFFCGSCAVLRRTALAEVGGIAVEPVTEDAHTALKMHRRGWSTAYLRITQAGGLATETLSAHVGQRIRWARGMAQIFRIDNPFLGRGLRLSQRFCYAAAMLHFFSGIPRLVFLLAPLAYLLFDLHIFNALPLMAIAYGLPHLVHATLTNARIQGDFRPSFWSEVYETCLAYYTMIPTTVALLNPKAGSFNVTAKGGCIEQPFFEARIARPYLALMALNLVGVVVGLLKLAFGTGELNVVLINLFWTAYNLAILAGTLAAAWEKRQLREHPRVAVKLPAMLRLEDDKTLRTTTVDLSRGGARVLLPEGRTLPAGARLWLSVFAAPEEVPLPVTVMGQEGRNLRTRFDPLSVDEEAALVRVLFSRADAWARWRDGRKRAHPLTSLRSIFVFGASNAAKAVASWRAKPALTPGARAQA